MRSITDDQEATNEELQSDNEELLSSSEELQSLNEELETRKEELQSTNEELLVVNQEMVTLNELLKASRDYSETIVSTIREPLLVLDKSLRIKTANQSFYETFAMAAWETEGKLFFDIEHKQWDILTLRNQLEKVLPENKSFYDFEVTHYSKKLGTRYLLLNAREMPGVDVAEKLILLAIEDVTVKAKAQKKIEDSNKRNNMMLMQSPFAFSLMMGKEMVITTANNLMKEFWGKGQDVEGKALLAVLPELADQPFPAMIRSVYTTGTPISANESLARLMHNGRMEDRYFNIIYQPYIEVDETISGVIAIAHEVTEQVIANKKITELQKLHSEEMEEEVRQRTAELSLANELLGKKNGELQLMNKELDSFTYVSSHDLQEPLRKIQAFADRIIEREAENLTVVGKDYFRRMQSAAARMQLLIEDLLAFSRLSTAERKFENADLTKIVKEVENDLKRRQ